MENHCTTTKSIHWATIMASKKNPCNIIIVILYHKDWNPLPQQLDLATHREIHTVANIPTNAIWYPYAPQWPSYYNQLETSLTTIICIHSQDSPPNTTPSPHDSNKSFKKLTTYTYPHITPHLSLTHTNITYQTNGHILPKYLTHYPHHL
jgi:hypothetical protein